LVAQDGKSESASKAERSKRRERAQRILDAAAELVQRWGYKKTTIDDIARQAGVAKGTIYLHWKTREELFIALFLREAIDAGVEMLERVRSDPEGMLLHNLTKHTIYVTLNRPLIKALYVGDVEMLGELVHSEHETMVMLTQRKLHSFEGILELMRNKGMIRTDMSIPALIHVYSAIVMGFLTVEGYLPEQYHLPIEQAVEELAETVRRTFGPEEPVLAATLKEVESIFHQIYQQYLDTVKEQVQREMEV
jgi:AcrR family transcriptional regulator